jgi:hypothetical protein
MANPSKTGGDWWYGRSVRDGAAGMFPKAYVQEIITSAQQSFLPEFS